VTVDADELAALQAAAERTGRRFTVMSGREAVVNWAVGYEPNLGDGAVSVYELSKTRLVALGVALALCWQPHRGALDGREVAVADFEQLLMILAARRGDRSVSGVAGSNASIKGALLDLHEMGFLRTTDETISLGPAMAQLTAPDWATIEASITRLRDPAP
jgi:hypothetical protein